MLLFVWSNRRPVHICQTGFREVLPQVQGKAAPNVPETPSDKRRGSTRIKFSRTCEIGSIDLQRRLDATCTPNVMRSTSFLSNYLNGSPPVIDCYQCYVSLECQRWIASICRSSMSDLAMIDDVRCLKGWGLLVRKLLATDDVSERLRLDTFLGHLLREPEDEVKSIDMPSDSGTKMGSHTAKDMVFGRLVDE